MTDCDKKSKTDQELKECYTKVIEEDDPCMSSETSKKGKNGNRYTRIKSLSV